MHQQQPHLRTSVESIAERSPVHKAEPGRQCFHGGWVSKNRRRGVTLLEMLLVMAILVLVGALAAPAFINPMQSYRLRKAGDALRVTFNRARIRAMRSGITQMFRYQINGNVYRVQVYAANDVMLESAGLQAASDAQTQSNSNNAMPQDISGTTQDNPLVTQDPFLPGATARLPEGVAFAAGSVEVDVRSNAIMQQSGELGTNGQWSTPIMFYADGTTSDANIFLNNQSGGYLHVNLRGLTGIAKVSDILSQEELPQMQ